MLLQSARATPVVDFLAGALTELSLAGNSIHNDGAAALAAPLRANTALRVLILTDNGIGPVT